MDEHPGDTLGKRFLTFWGALAAIVAVALLLGLYRWIIIPSDSAPTDGGAGLKRVELLTAAKIEQKKEFETAAEVEPGKTVRIPADTVIPYAARVLASKKATASTIKTPAAIAAEADAKAASGVHDPTVSEFDKK
jgi:hypothetical protein